MSAPLHFRSARVNGECALIPCDDAAEAWLRRRKVGDAVAVEPIQVRNAERSALYWVLCSLVADNHAELKTRENVSDAIKLLSGYVELCSFNVGGSRYILRKPKSIAFASMSESQFEIFFESALQVIGSDLLPGVDIEAMRREAYLRAGQE